MSAVQELEDITSAVRDVANKYKNLLAKTGATSAPTGFLSNEVLAKALRTVTPAVGGYVLFEVTKAGLERLLKDYPGAKFPTAIAVGIIEAGLGLYVRQRFSRLAGDTLTVAGVFTLGYGIIGLAGGANLLQKLEAKAQTQQKAQQGAQQAQGASQ